MTQVVQTKNEQVFEQSSVLIGSEAKNPLPISGKQFYMKLTLSDFNSEKTKILDV